MLLTEIRILSMRQCDIPMLPDGITNLVALQELHMNDNGLEMLPGVRLLGAANECLSLPLSPSFCSFVCLPVCPSIPLSVVLHGFHSTDLPRRLTNQPSFLPAPPGPTPHADLSPCADMRILRLSNNKLQSLPMSVVELAELRELSLMGNMVQRLPGMSRLVWVMDVDGVSYPRQE